MSTLSVSAASGRLTVEWSLRATLLLLASVIFVLNLQAFFSWSERRGVHDDICYLRQAHLFQRFGLSGIDTDLARDDDGFFRDAQRSIGVDPVHAICHPPTKAGKRVLQYPPGTGFLLSAFPEGSQVAWLYTTSMLVVMAATIFIVSIAGTPTSIVSAGLFGLCALYFMVNPTKASYSMAPTTAICIVAALLSPILFQLQDYKRRLAVAAAIGLLLGLSVTFRTANVLLVAGYVVVLGIDFLRKRDWQSFALGGTFAAAYSIAIAPALIANYVNAGSPFATTYAAHDAAPPDLTFGIVREYLKDMQGYLAIVAIAATVWMMRRSRHIAAVAVVAISLAVNLGFFFTHAIFTQYYIMPPLTLAMWSLMAQWLMEHRRSAA